LLPYYAIAPQNYQHKEKTAMSQFVKSRKKQWQMSNIVTNLDGAHDENK